MILAYLFCDEFRSHIYIRVRLKRFFLQCSYHGLSKWIINISERPKNITDTIIIFLVAFYNFSFLWKTSLSRVDFTMQAKFRRHLYTCQIKMFFFPRNAVVMDHRINGSIIQYAIADVRFMFSKFDVALNT